MGATDPVRHPSLSDVDGDMSDVPIELYTDLLGKYHELVKELTALKREGFAPQPAYQEPVKPPELPEAIQAAIRTVAPEGSGLERDQVLAAWAMLKSGLSESKVAEQILEGEEIAL